MGLVCGHLVCFGSVSCVFENLHQWLLFILFKLNAADGILNCFYFKKQKQFCLAVGVALSPGLLRAFPRPPYGY